MRHLHYLFLLLGFLALILGAPVFALVFFLVWLAFGSGNAKTVRHYLAQLINVPALKIKSHWIISIMIGVSVTPIAIGMNHLSTAAVALLFPAQMTWFVRQQAELDAMSFVVAGLLVGPILEELFFRGFVFKAASAKKGVRYAAIASSILYGLLSFDIVGAVAFGIGMCFLLTRTGSIVFPVLVNAAGAALHYAFILSFDRSGAASYSDSLVLDDLFDPQLLWCSAGLVALSLLLMAVLRVRLKQPWVDFWWDRTPS